MQSPVDAALSNQVVQQAITDLSIQDTVHDFWEGGRGEANPITDANLATFRNQIVTISEPLIRGRTITDVTFDEIKSKGPGIWTGKPSDYERNLIRKYEDKYPSHLYSKTKETITYQDILDDETKGDLLRKKYLGNRGFCNILSIIPAKGQFFDSFNEKQRNTIANFILSFMFGLDRLAIGKGNFGITYDAGPVAPRKVFADIEQMYNYIYPQNITDSAATSFKSKRIRYVFPSEPDNPNISIVRSNMFTSSNITMFFEKNGYSELNRYGFSWKFKDRTGAITNVPFGPGQSDGPSVNYLVTSLLNGGPFYGNKEKNTIVNISPIQSLYTANNGIILDLKRTGDFEQVHASLNDQNVIFATIDHLCSFYARMLHKPCIWSNNASSEIVLYRFDIGPPPPPDVAFKQNMFFYAQEQIRRINMISNIKSGVLLEDLTKAQQEFTLGRSAFFVTQSKFSEGQIAYIQNPGGYTADNVDKQGYLADALTTAFFRLKCKDTVQHIKALDAQAKTFEEDPTINYDIINKLVTNPGVFTATPTGAPNTFTLVYTDISVNPNVLTPGIETMITGLKSKLEALKSILDIQLQTTEEKFYKPMFISNAKIPAIPLYDHKVTNVNFGLSPGHLKSIHTAFRAMVGIVFSGRAGRDRDKKVIQFLTEYYTARDALLGTFYNEELAEQARNASDIDTKELVISEANLPTLGVNAIQMVRNVYAIADPTKPGGAKRDRTEYEAPPLAPAAAGPPSLAQTNDLALLFHDICGKAAAYVESMISTHPETDNGRNIVAVGTLLNTAPATREIMQDIAIHWETELLRIREDSLDNYGVKYVPTQADAFISMLVSTCMTPIGTDIQSYLDYTISPRDMVEYQDFGGYLKTTQIPEVRNLIVLTVFDNMLTQKPRKYFEKYAPQSSATYGATREWTDYLVQHLLTVVQTVNGDTELPSPPSEKKGRVGPGGRRPLFTTP